MSAEILGWIGAAFGVTGSMLLSLNIPATRYCLWLFLAGNLVMAANGHLTNNRPLLTMQIALAAIGVLGVYRWFIQRKRGETT